MTTLTYLKTVAAVIGLGAASCAYAQKEQWLQYHTSQEDMSYGYKYLDLIPTPPPGVALPTLNNKPVFAKWFTPLDPAGFRWICLDGKSRSGPRNRLFVDRNGDGRLDDETPQEATTRDSYSAVFDPVKLVFKGEDGPIAYHLGFRFMNYSGDSTYLIAMSSGYYQGQVDLGSGKKIQVRLIDRNVNGAFNDRLDNTGQSDYIQIGSSSSSQMAALGKLLEYDKKWLSLEVALDGAFIKIQPATDLTFGKLDIPPSVSEVTLAGVNGQFTRKPGSTEMTLPVGQYYIRSWKSSRTDEKGKPWQLSGTASGRLTTESLVEVKTDSVCQLNVGEPIRANLQITESSGQIAFGLRLQGGAGEQVELMTGTERPKPPRLTLVNKEGFRYTNSFEYG